MYPFLVAIGHSAYFHAALAGAVASAVIDVQAFRAWKSFNDAKSYSWNTAIFRWTQGAAFGLLTAAGFAGLS